MSYRILFIDPVSPYDYNPDIVETKGIGASEQYLMYIAEELAKFNRNYVYIANRHLKEKVYINNVCYLPITDIPTLKNIDRVIMQRSYLFLQTIKVQFPESKIYMFNHDFFEGGIMNNKPKDELQELADNVKFICVSEWAKNNLYTNLKLRGINNIDIDFNHFFIPIPKFEKLKYDKNKLCFFSASHKGLEYTLKIFKHLLEFNPKFRLYVANPTYDQIPEFKGEIKDKIVNLGNITRNEVFSHLDSSLCALHLNNVYPETFGCVNAESNAVHTPVICFDIGANSEVLDNPYLTNQFVDSKSEFRVDVNNLMFITETISKWYNKKPIINLRANLEKYKIMKKWEKILQ